MILANDHGTIILLGPGCFALFMNDLASFAVSSWCDFCGIFLHGVLLKFVEIPEHSRRDQCASFVIEAAICIICAIGLLCLLISLL